MGTQGGTGIIAKIAVSSTLTAIAKLKDIDYPEFEKVLAESTTHDSPGGWDEYTATGKRKLSSLTAKLIWDKSQATHAAILAAFDATDPVNMSIQDPNGTEVIAFAAHIQKIKRMATKDDLYTCDVTIQPTGRPTITP